MFKMCSMNTEKTITQVEVKGFILLNLIQGSRSASEDI